MEVMSEILLTGATGWLGTRFSKLLAEENREIRCLVLKGDDASFLDGLGFEVVRGDVTKPETLEGIANGVETVFHTAALQHPDLFGARGYFRVNVQGTKNMLDCAIEGEAERFIYVSSEAAAEPKKERLTPVNEYSRGVPYMNYGKSKRLAEEAVNKAFIQGQIDTTIIRPSWFYGPEQSERQTQLMKMIRDGKAVLFGDGNNLRSMTYIDNLCEALLLAEKTECTRGETYFIADEEPYTLLEIYETIADILEVELETVKIPQFFSDMAALADGVFQKLGIYQNEIHVAGEMSRNISCSVEKAKKDLGYEPETDLRKGMKKAIEWCREEDKL